MKKYLIIIIIFMIFGFRITYLNIHDKDMYKEKLNNKINNYDYSKSAPRGRIIDRNGNVLVDNKGIKTIYYTKLKGITGKEELEIATKLANILDVEINDNSLKNYWLIKNNNGDFLITEEEWQLYEERKISSQELKDLKNSRISVEMLDNLSALDKEIATIYSLMNKGYSYEKKEIIKNIDDQVYTEIIDSNIKGITTELSWERVYNYGEVLKDIFGTVGAIPEEKKEQYLESGYNLDDIVGLSYLELYYEDYLKGEKDLYK